MRNLLDRLALLMLCGILFFLCEYTAAEVISILLGAIIFCSLGFAFSGKWISILLGFLWIFMSFFFPPMLLFLPLAFYEIFCSKNIPAAIIGGLLILFNIRQILIEQQLAVYLCLFLFLYSVLAVYLMYRTETTIVLKSQLLRSKDNQRELEYLMEERITAQSKEQDNEVRVATLRERSRIAREIHDNVGHLLSRSILMLGALKATRQEESLKEPLSTLTDTLSAAMESIRTSVHDLHDESIDLKAAAEEVIQNFNFCPVHFDYDMSAHANREVKYCFLSILKEALSNTAKHSNANSVTVILREHPNMYQLLIHDNGTKTGARPGVSTGSSGIGLVNMKERVRVLNGTTHISRENGFRIFATIPK